MTDGGVYALVLSCSAVGLWGGLAALNYAFRSMSRLGRLPLLFFAATVLLLPLASYFPSRYPGGSNTRTAVTIAVLAAEILFYVLLSVRKPEVNT